MDKKVILFGSRVDYLGGGGGLEEKACSGNCGHIVWVQIGLLRGLLEEKACCMQL